MKTCRGVNTFCWHWILRIYTDYWTLWRLFTVDEVGCWKGFSHLLAAPELDCATHQPVQIHFATSPNWSQQLTYDAWWEMISHSDHLRVDIYLLMQLELLKCFSFLCSAVTWFGLIIGNCLADPNLLMSWVLLSKSLKISEQSFFQIILKCASK